MENSGLTTVACRDHADDCGQGEHECIRDGRAIDSWEVADGLVNIKVIALNNNLEDHLENRDANTDGQIDVDGLTFLDLGGGNRAHDGNEVEAALNAERGAWDTNGRPCDERAEMSYKSGWVTIHCRPRQDH